MRVRVPPSVRLLVPLALAAAHDARAGVTGNVEVQGQSTESRTLGGASTQSAILMETLSLHYAGMPLGAAVAVATAGAGLSNVRGWSDGAHRFDARVYSFDGSLGLLPRRGLPLRLYASGSVPDGTGGLLAAAGAGPSLLYGGTLQLDPGRVLPGLRLDLSEARTSRPGHPELSDLQQRLAASGHGAVAGQRVDLTVRLEEERRDAAGALASRAATLTVGSAFHQTQLVATAVERSFPTLSGITSDRTAAGTSSQRWSSRLSTELGARLAEARAGAASGTLGDARLSATWIPLRTTQQVTLSAGANGGFTRSASPDQRTSGSTSGASGRAAWSRPVGRASLGLGGGVAANACDCPGGTSGTTTLLDAGCALGIAGAGGASAQADYTVVRAAAPLARGGDRLEHHARTAGRVPVGAATSLTASLSWDEGVRELLDIASGAAVTRRERALGASIGAATRAWRTSLSAELRHSRGRVVTEAGSPFVVGASLAVPAVTTALATAAWSPRYDLSAQAQVIGTWVDVDGRPRTTSVGASGALTWRLGRISIAAQYQTFRVDHGAGAGSTLQQSVRGVLSRPFEL